MKHNRVLGMTLIALMCVVIIICSQIIVPMAFVPFTMQTFAVFASLLILGGMKGTAAVALYLLMGAIGLPVFTGFSGGFGHIQGATGGYLAGFLLTAVIYWIFEKKADENPFVKWIVLAAGLVACYTAGTVWFAVMYGSKRTVWGILMLCVIPYIIPDIAKMILADLVAKRVRKAFHHEMDELQEDER